MLNPTETINNVIYITKKELDTLLDTIQDAIIIHNAEGIIIQVNRTLITWLQVRYRDVVGKPCSIIPIELNGQPFYDVICHQLKPNQRVKPIEFASPTWARGGFFRLKSFPLYEDDTLIEVIHQIEDITQARKLQHHMLQAEKLAALGRLSASMAHEVNNPLQSLRSGLRLLSRPQLTEIKRQQYVTRLVNEVERLITITTRILDYARPGRVGKEAADLHQLWQSTLDLIHKQLEQHQISLTFELMPNPPIVEVVPEQIKQVFLNLILNSIDAMPNGGKLTFSTCHNPEDKFVVASIADTGTGIPPHLLAQISEPFFTTKETGTGLGLSISYSIIEAHGGWIDVQSKPDEGCCFLINLPVR